MDDNVHIHASLTNLTHLWTRMGVGQRCAGSQFIWHSNGWPFRVWMDWEAAIDGLELIHQVVLEQSFCVVVPLWNRKTLDADSDVRKLEQWGYKEFMTQTVMVLKTPFPDVGEPDCADLYCIRTPQDVQRWSDIVSTSFGYIVDSHVVEQLLHDTCVTLVTLRAGKAEIGSACVFCKEGIAGVHYVGVLPQYRRNGMATRLMRQVIHLCCRLGATCVTLQASPQAVNLYKKMGFVELLKYKNYRFTGSHP